jgi:ribosomal protein S4
MKLEELTLKGYDLGKIAGYFSLRVKLTDLMLRLNLVDTVAEAKRLVVGGVVALNGNVITNTYYVLTGVISNFEVNGYFLATLTVVDKEVMLYIKKEKYENNINN